MRKHTVLPFKKALLKGTRLLLAKERNLVATHWGKILSIRSDSWEIQIHETPENAFLAAEKMGQEPRNYPVDMFFLVVGQTDTPDLANLLAAKPTRH